MKLDKYEKDLLASFERGEWKTLKNFSHAKKHFREVAQETIQNDRRVIIRLSQKDLETIRVRAARQGLPYQNLISSVIHKFVVGSLREA